MSETQLDNFSGKFNVHAPIVKNIIDSIEVVDPQVIDTTLLRSDKIHLRVSDVNEGKQVQLSSLDSGSYIAVIVPRSPDQPVLLCYGMATKGMAGSFNYCADGTVTDDNKSTKDNVVETGETGINKRAVLAALPQSTLDIANRAF